MSEFFGHKQYVIRRKGKFAEVAKEFDVADEQGNRIGAVREEDQSKGGKLARMTVFGALSRPPLVVSGDGGTKLLEVKPDRRLPSGEICNAAGEPVVRVVSKSKFKTDLTLQDVDGETLGTVCGDRSGVTRSFPFLDPGGTEMGRLTRKSESVGKVLGTSAHYYHVLDVSGTVSERTEVAMVGAAITLALSA